MEIIDFAKAREDKLASIAREKDEPRARYAAMLEALDRENLSPMEYIVQSRALHMAYRIVEHSPCWGKKQRNYYLQVWSALEAVVPVIGDMIMANSCVKDSVGLAGQRFTASEVGLWAARRMILDYLLILIDDKSSPDDWLGICDKDPMQNVFGYLGYQKE